MVFCLPPDFEQAKRAVGVEGCGGKHLEEIGLADVVGTGAGHQDAAVTQHLEGPQVELLIAAEGGIEVVS